MYKIISDSACDLSQAYIDKNDISIAPFSVSFDDINYYREGIDISRMDFYNKMVDEKAFPKSSLPSVDTYVNLFMPAVEAGIPIVCLTISLELSGSYNSARTAKDLILEDYPDAQIAVIDSRMNTVTQALLVNEVVRMRDNGVSFEQMQQNVEKLIPSGHIFFTVGSLDYLKKGGRIGKLATIATGKLGIKPIIIMHNGEIGLGGIGRNRSKLKQSVLDVGNKYFTDNNLSKDDYSFSVGWGYDEQEGLDYEKDVEAALGIKCQSDTNVLIGITTACHTGPYPIGFGIMQKYETL